ncbi:MAG: hypothetical protein AAFU53_10585, partial [Cyanobacteria bacterium J06632_3]
MRIAVRCWRVLPLIFVMGGMPALAKSPTTELHVSELGLYRDVRSEIDLRQDNLLLLNPETKITSRRKQNLYTENVNSTQEELEESADQLIRQGGDQFQNNQWSEA